MPFVIAILAFVVFFVVLKDKTKEGQRKARNDIADRRKTFAAEEVKLVTKYLYQKPIEEAIELGTRELIEEGFDPCVPLEYFQDEKLGRYHPKSYEDYDSEAVRIRRDRLQDLSHCSKDKYPYNPYMVYDGWPKDEWGWMDSYNTGDLYSLVPIGTRFMHPDHFGSCIIKDIIFDPEMYWSVVYVCYEERTRKEFQMFPREVDKKIKLV